MTGALIKAIARCPPPVIAAVNGVCVGAGAVIATACDLRLGTPRAKSRSSSRGSGSSGADMGAAHPAAHRRPWPRAELLYTGRSIDGGRGGALGLLQPRRR